MSKGNPILINALEELIATLREDPYNYSGQHKIKRLVGVRSGEGQWRIRWRDYRLRYDILDKDVILHAFRHRKDAY